jgi:hypothetical protein
MYNTVNDTKEDALKDYVVQVLDTATRTVKGTYTVVPNKDKGGEFVFTFYENFTIFGTPQRNFIVKVYSRDIIGDLSNYVEVNPTNIVPVVQSFDILSGVSSVFVHITTTPEADIAGYQVFRSLTANFTKNSSTLVYDGPDTYITLNVPSSSTYYYAVAAYDSFSKTGLNVSGEQNSTPLSADATTWTKTGLQFTVDSVVANKLNWTAGTVIRNGSNTYTITAGTTTWTSGFVYVYFNPAVSLTALQVTTTLLIAVGVGCYPIATYTGGSASNIKGGDGNAFISGSQIIAGTVGASEIKAGSIVASLLDTTNAVITGTAQITDGIITNAKIGNSIMSLNYNPTTYKGWSIDKTGNINTYGSLGLYDTSGNVIFAGGNFNWNNAKGPGVPQVGATRNVFLGNWSSGYSYVVGDIVMDALGYGWSCVTPHTSGGSASTPVYPITSNSYWALYTIKGGTGPAGLTTATVYIYRRLAGANPPALPTQPVTYTFSSAVVTGLDNNWSYILPVGTDPLYVSAATASGGGNTDTIQANEWATPVVLAKNGTDGNPGTPGANGINTATIYLYQTTTTSTPPSLPNADVTYTFATGVTTGLTNGWVRSLPTTGAYRWVTTGTALGTGTTDVITSAEWATVSLLAQDGVNGARTAILDMYQWSASAPTTFPVGTSTYTWATGQFTAPGTLNGWGLVPTAAVKGQTLYVTRTIYADSGTTATTSITWNATTATARGLAGTDGINGSRTAFMELYRWAATTPSTYPSGTSTYTWATGAFTTPTTANGWSLLPGAAVKGQTLYAIGQSYSDTGTSGTTNITWASSTPYAVGAAGIDGTSAAYVIVNGDQAFKFLAGATTPVSSTITLTAVLYGGLTSYSWEYWSGSSWAAFGNSTSTFSLAYNNTAFTGTSLRVRCSSGSYSDEITIVKLYDGVDGKDSISGYLTNETATLPADVNGTVSSYTGASGNFKMFKGITDVTSSATFSVTTALVGGITLNIVNTAGTTKGAYSVSGTMSADSVTFTLNSTYSGVTISKLLVLSKSKTGATGGTGPTGPAGAGTNYTGASDPTTSNPAAAINGDSYFQTTTQLMWVKIAGTWQKVVPQITSGNATTFIASGAIGQLQVGSAAIGTLAIQGEAVTVENVIAVNAVSVTKTTSASTWTNFLSYSTPGNAIGYPTIIDLQFPDSGTTSNMVGGSSVSYALRVIDSSSGLVLASFSNTYVNRTRFLAKISSIPAQITIQRQILYTPGTGYLVYDVAYKSALLLARTVKK